MIIINLINTPPFSAIKDKCNQLYQSYQSKCDGEGRRETRDFVQLRQSERMLGICSPRGCNPSQAWYTLTRQRLTAHDGHRSLGQVGPATCLCFIEMRYGQHRVTLAAPLTDNAWPRRIHEIARSRRISDATARLQLSVGRLVLLSGRDSARLLPRADLWPGPSLRSIKEDR